MTSRVMTYAAFRHSYLSDEFKVVKVRQIDEDWEQGLIRRGSYWTGAEQFQPGDVVTVEQPHPGADHRWLASVSVFLCGAERDMHETYHDTKTPSDWGDVKFILKHFTTDGDVDAAKVKGCVAQMKAMKTRNRNSMIKLRKALGFDDSVAV